jgi:phage shock protein C
VEQSIPQANSMQPFMDESVNNIAGLSYSRIRRKIMNPETRKLYRSRNNRMIAGVCAGLAEFFGIDATVVRLVFAAGALVGFGSFILIYLVMFVVVPEEPI